MLRMSVKLYYHDWSPPARAARLTASAIELNIEIVNVNLAELEHMQPEYLKVVIDLLQIFDQH